MSRNLFALGGWGVAPEHFAAVLRAARPDARVTVYPPTEDNLARLLREPAEELAGWSLGAHLLLRAEAAGKISPGRRVTLVTPFAAFPAEAGVGGRVELTKVKFLRRRLRRDPLAALNDFHARAGLAAASKPELPYSLAELEHGLDLLEITAAVTRGSTPTSACRLLLGGRDLLLDPEASARTFPEAKVVPEAGHDARDFLAALIG